MSIENQEQNSAQSSVKATIESIQTQVKAISEKLNSDFEDFKNGEKPMELGISLLNSKPQLLLDYVTLLSYYSLLKLTKQSIKEHPLILNLIKIRAYLEKIKPLETKMKYQIDKLIKAASSDLNNTEQTVDDPYMFKPNPNLLVQDDEDEDEDEDKEDGDDVYKAPRIAPMPYDDNPGYSKEQRSEQRKKEKASRSRMLRDLANQYSEAPEQDKVIGTLSLEEGDRELMEREVYEEDNFTRLTTTKKQKKKLEKLSQRSLHNELLDFDDFHGSGKMSELDQTNKQSSLSRSRQSTRDDSDDSDSGFGSSGKRSKRKHGSLDNLVTDGLNSGVANSKFSSAKRYMKKKLNKKRR